MQEQQKDDLTMCFGFTVTDDVLLQSYYSHLLQALF